MVDDRERLRTTFDTAADRYDRARPRYPSERFALTGSGPGDRVLEIGPATRV